ncbi:MAG: hypothetical protein HYV08_07485 [Deltaproteobacteria bacterium]|nr:hypothetical protein [Deltaproteobacteria bacterium]
MIPQIRIRWHECIGCQICARVCEGLAWNAIDMIPIEEFEATYGVQITNEKSPPEAAAEASSA